MTTNFQAFQATRKEVSDLVEALPDYETFCGGAYKQSAHLYCGNLVIMDVIDHWDADIRAKGKFHLVIGNREFVSNDRAELERALYEFARDEGYVEGMLCDELKAWCAAQGLPYMSADELICEEITDEQRAWLSRFSERWEALMREIAP